MRDLSLFGLNVEPVLEREEHIARQGVGIAYRASAGCYGIVDIRQFVEQVETVDHEYPAAVARRAVCEAHVPDRIGGVEVVHTVAAAGVAGEVGTDAEACRELEHAGDAVVEVVGVQSREAGLRRSGVTVGEVTA